MNRLAFLICTVLVSSASAGVLDIIKLLFAEVSDDIAAVKNPVEQVVVGTASSQCQLVKRIIGVEYDQYDGDEPDMSKLQVVYTTRDGNTTYNLTDIHNIATSENFNATKPLLIVFHGFTDDPSQSTYVTISNAFLDEDKYNILGLDASSLIRFFYLRSSTMVRFIGEKMGETLKECINAGLSPADIYLVGHSLGSHIAAFTSKTLLAETGKRVGRITGLDPAGPCFTTIDSGLRLNSTDADYVDVIHTDGGVFGLNDAVGDVDFYPNGGADQPSCLLQTCSHRRAWELFSETVLNATSFPALNCTTWQKFKKGSCDNNTVNYMGYGSKSGLEGTFYLQTNGNTTYARGDDGLTYENDGGIISKIEDVLGL